MNRITGEKVLSGTWAEVWLNGLRVLEIESITAKITPEREPVQIGASEDSKITKFKCEGEISMFKVLSRWGEVIKQYQAGRDVRFEIMAKLADPDAYGGQTERYSISNVWLNEIPFISEWGKGGVVKEKVPFGFTIEDLQNLDQITA